MNNKTDEERGAFAERAAREGAHALTCHGLDDERSHGGRVVQRDHPLKVFGQVQAPCRVTLREGHVLRVVADGV